MHLTHSALFLGTVDDKDMLMNEDRSEVLN